MLLVGSRTKAIAQHLILRVAAGLPGIGLEMNPEGKNCVEPFRHQARSLKSVVGAWSVSPKMGLSSM